MAYNKARYGRYGRSKRYRAIVFFGPNGLPPKKYNFDNTSSFDKFLSKDHPKYYYYNLYSAATGKFVVRTWNPDNHWKSKMRYNKTYKNYKNSAW